jgi:hypothetical protein
MLHRVGDIDLLPLDADLLHDPRQQLARRPDEWPSLQIFLIAGLLADEEGPGRRRPFAEDGLRRLGIERTPPAALGRPGQRGQIMPLGQKIGGGSHALFYAGRGA